MQDLIRGYDLRLAKTEVSSIVRAIAVSVADAGNALSTIALLAPALKLLEYLRRTCTEIFDAGNNDLGSLQAARSLLALPS
jgi:hypothetical protein